MSFETKPFIYNLPKMWDKPLHMVALTAAIFWPFCGYRLICLTNMFILTLLWQRITTERADNAKCSKLKIYLFVHMHFITVQMGVIVFNRQFFIYLDGPSIGVSLDISRVELSWLWFNVTFSDISAIQWRTDVQFANFDLLPGTHAIGS